MDTIDKDTNTVYSITELLEKVSIERYSTATTLALKKVKEEMRHTKVPEEVKWCTQEEYKGKRREVSVSDIRRDSVI